MLKHAEGHHEQGLGTFDKSQQATLPLPCPHLPARLQLNGFTWNLVWGLSWKSAENF